MILSLKSQKFFGIFLTKLKKRDVNEGRKKGTSDIVEEKDENFTKTRLVIFVLG